MFNPILAAFTAAGAAIGGPPGAIVGAIISIPFVRAKIDSDAYKEAAKLGCSREQFDNLDDYDDSGHYRGRR